MRILLIGDMKKMDGLYHWLEISSECFEVELIISENELTSAYYTCPIERITFLERIRNEYDIIFICSVRYNEIRSILLSLGIDKSIILSEIQICRFLSKRDSMDYYAKQIFNCYQKQYIDEAIQVGEYTYGNPNVLNYRDGTKLAIGKFCSIAPNVSIIMGGDHRSDWCTTYPFNSLMNEFRYIEGNPKSNGDIVIGNDVWMARDCKILSGVHIGDGAIIAANAVVTKDVEPYSIVGGIPAKVIRKRFDEETVRKFEEIQWWNWDKEHIYDAIPLLQSNRTEQLFEFYESVVKNHMNNG